MMAVAVWYCLMPLMLFVYFMLWYACVLLLTMASRILLILIWPLQVITSSMAPTDSIYILDGIYRQ